MLVNPPALYIFSRNPRLVAEWLDRAEERKLFIGKFFISAGGLLHNHQCSCLFQTCPDVSGTEECKYVRSKQLDRFTSPLAIRMQHMLGSDTFF